MLSTKDTWNVVTLKSFECKKKNILQINTSQEKAGELTLISDEGDCNLRSVIGNKEKPDKNLENYSSGRSNNSKFVCMWFHNFKHTYIQSKSIAL